jgi:EmrB/QacA subfamily drug resistance transporter
LVYFHKRQLLKGNSMVASDNKKWFALALLSAVQFMVVLDIAIVNVALPSIKVDLGFSQGNLQWVISAYALVFGGFLLLGGRLSDILGRRRLFLAGLVLFTLSSFLAGMAWSEGSLIAARSLQGLGAAIISPAALSILTTTFREGRERNIALGVWGAVGGFGAAAGVLLGGVLTDALSWEWIFFVNIPVGAAGFALAPFLLAESRDAAVRSFDALGAVLVTGGLMTLVFAITQANDYGWGAVKTWAIFAVAGALLAAFVGWERRHPEPLMRFGILRIRTVLGANVAGFILGTALFAMFLMLTLYMQQVLGYSAMKTGVAYLATAGTAIVWSGVSAQLVNRLGVKPVLITGMVFLSAGLVYFTQVSVGGSYLGDLLPGFLLIAVGMGFSFVPISIAALAGVQPAEAGLASGLINTSQQIGGALGIAALSAVATSRTESAAETGTALPHALVNGFHGAFWGGTIVALVGVLAAITLIRREELDTAPAAEAVPAAA